MPEYEWKEWCFASTPNNYWVEPQHQKDYMKWLGNRLGYTKLSDWYSISKDVFNNNYGGSFLAVAFDNSPITAVKKTFPEYDWKEWLFGHASTDFWQQTTNLRQYFEWLGEQIEIQYWEDWYNITSEVLIDHNGGSLLNLKQNGSYYSLIIDSFPEYDWKRWRFKTIPQKYWEDIENCREYLTWLGNQLGIQRIEDWYNVTQKDFNQNNGGGIMDFYKGSPSAIIITCFDTYNWEIEKFGKTKKRQQHLYHLVKRIFPKWHVGWDVKHQEIKFKQTGRSMEIDIFIQKLKLGFEYQGEQHFIAMKHGEGKKL